MAVDQENIWTMGHSFHRSLDGGELSVRQVRRDVREVDLRASLDDFDRVECVVVAAHDGNMGAVAIVCNIDARDDPHLLDLVLLRDLFGQSSLFLSEFRQKANVRDRAHESCFRDSSERESDAFFRKAGRRVREDGLTVRAHDAVCPVCRRMTQ